MTSYDGGRDRDSLDPEYEALFRPEDVAPPAPRPAFEPEPDPEPVVAEPVVAEPVVAVEPAPTPEPPPEPEPALAAEPEPEPILAAPPIADAPAAAVPPADPVADTGRLFRSQGVLGHENAVLALTSDHYGRLRTLERRTDEAPKPDAPLVLDDAAPLEEEPVSHRRRRGPSMPSHRSGITAGAVYIIVFGVTLVVAFLNALLAGGDLGWPTGLALLISSVYAALVVRRPDDTVAIIVPPLAFLLATLTAGQLFLGSAEGSLLNRATVVFFTLAANWFWVIGATVAALVIVLVRRRRG